VLVAERLEIPAEEIRRAVGNYEDEDCRPTGNEKAMTGR
jgi:hypothetical protein